MVDEGYVHVNKHPTEDIFIYNYTPKTQFDWVWNDVTMKCRGLILNSYGDVVARPFEKFFSLEQLDHMPEIVVPHGLEPFEVSEKVDGSLGILYWARLQPDKSAIFSPQIATRGSFVSDQAIEANKMLAEKYKFVKWDPYLTYLFEIIYPSNRIVCDYGSERKLVLLAVIDTVTGRELDVRANCPAGIEVVKMYSGVTDWQSITKQYAGDGREGFVIRFYSGLRIKIKYDEYKRMHRILCNTTERTVWEQLMLNNSMDFMLENIPDEFYNWLKQTIANLQTQYDVIKSFCIQQLHDIKCRLSAADMLESRKAWAIEIQRVGDTYGNKYNGIMFGMISGRTTEQIDVMIWKLLKPSANKPFKEIVDES